MIIRKIPFRCPVCGGSRVVPNGFYRQTSGDWLTTDATPETCRSCNGIGIIYGEEIEDDNKKPPTFSVYEQTENDLQFY